MEVYAANCGCASKLKRIAAASKSPRMFDEEEKPRKNRAKPPATASRKKWRCHVSQNPGAQGHRRRLLRETERH
jgi:hypothetical protein